MAYDFLKNHWVGLLIALMVTLVWITTFITIEKTCKKRGKKKLAVVFYFIASIVGVIALLGIFLLDPIDSVAGLWGSNKEK